MPNITYISYYCLFILLPTKAVFSLFFSSGGKGPFLTGKAKNIRQMRTFLGEGGSGVRDMALPSLGKLSKLIKLSSSRVRFGGGAVVI